MSALAVRLRHRIARKVSAFENHDALRPSVEETMQAEADRGYAELGECDLLIVSREAPRLPVILEGDDIYLVVGVLDPSDPGLRHALRQPFHLLKRADVDFYLRAERLLGATKDFSAQRATNIFAGNALGIGRTGIPFPSGLVPS